MTRPVWDRAEYARFRAILAAAGLGAISTIPAKVGSKIPAVEWADIKPGEEGPHWPATEARLLLTGRRSSGLSVIDVDCKKHDGFAALARLEALHGPLPRTLAVRSPSGGLHLYVLPSRSLITRTDTPAPGIDIRGEGGVVMVPGSVHPSGAGIYRIEES